MSLNFELMRRIHFGIENVGARRVKIVIEISLTRDVLRRPLTESFISFREDRQNSASMKETRQVSLSFVKKCNQAFARTRI